MVVSPLVPGLARSPNPMCRQPLKARDIDGVMARVMLIMPELLELFGEST
jgi:hypothetical protein